jgi:hypothetical protein
MKFRWARDAVELLPRENESPGKVVLPLNYCPVCRSRPDSNRQPTITHNFGPLKIRIDIHGTAMYMTVDET